MQELLFACVAQVIRGIGSVCNEDNSAALPWKSCMSTIAGFENSWAWLEGQVVPTKLAAAFLEGVQARLALDKDFSVGERGEAKGGVAGARTHLRINMQRSA